jgi:hypothetical protein
LADRTPRPPSTPPPGYVVDPSSPSSSTTAQEAGNSPAHAQMPSCPGPCMSLPSVAQTASHVHRRSP